MGGPNKQGAEKFQHLIKRGSEFDKWFNMTIKRQKEQKQVVIKDITKIYS